MMSPRTTILLALLFPITLSSCFIVPQSTQQHSTALSMSNPLFDFLKSTKTNLVKSLAGPYDSSAIRQKIDTYVDTNPVLMFSFTTCPFCLEAKSVLDRKGARYTVVELDVEADGKAIRAEMGDLLGRTSVPAVWIDGTFVGGCNDGPLGGVNGLERQGKLDDLLKGAGAI